MRWRAGFATVLFAALMATPALGQTPPAPPATAENPPSSEDTEGGPTVGNSRVGYIDSAIPASQFRLRFDAAYDDQRPNRAEFFWPAGFPHGPGLPLPEKRVDYQDLSGYLELAADERLSAFVEVPWRFLNPEVNPNAEGVGDMNAGFKAALVRSGDRVVTFQFRTYIPTGNAHRGLGNDHVSLEPALLVFQPLSSRLNLEGELRDWIPVGGTDFEGNILRYGLGVDYELGKVGGVQVVPVAEFVTWSVLGGKETVVSPSGLATVKDAAGDTIVNTKLGVRFLTGSLGEFYAGYGRPLSGSQWYENTFRLEWRFLF